MTVSLRAERLNRGLSVRQAAERMKVAAGTLDRAERGENIPHPSTALKIAKFYGYQVTEIWQLEELA